jgi:hypothetical protein
MDFAANARFGLILLKSYCCSAVLWLIQLSRIGGGFSAMMGPKQEAQWAVFYEFSLADADSTQSGVTGMRMLSGQSQEIDFQQCLFKQN